MQSIPPPSTVSPKESRNLYSILISLLIVFSLLILSLLFILSPPSSPLSLSSALPLSLSSSSSPPPSLAYFISGSDGDAARVLRLLHAAFHPRNLYLLHLDLAAPQTHRRSLALAVAAVPAFRSAGNVHVIGHPDAANPRGSSALAATLHGAAVLLRLSQGWDWFLNLDASDYPLVTQDDLLHVLSFLPRDLNFVQHTSKIGWRESRRLKQIIVDPGLYHSSYNDIFYATQKRELPNAYRLFTGSASVVLSRKFIEYCILGTDNFPRTLVMYYANTLSSHTDYFQTVLCNSPEFNRTIVNHNLHYAIWDTPPKRDPRFLGLNDSTSMAQSGAAFATRFSDDAPVLDHIDSEVLSRGSGRIVPGGWCLGGGQESQDPCDVWGNANVLKPGLGAKKLANFVTELLSNKSFHSHQCIYD